MGHTYYQEFEIAKLLKGKTIQQVTFTDHEGEVGLVFVFEDPTKPANTTLDKTWLDINITSKHLELRLEVDPKDYKQHVTNCLDLCGYWGSPKPKPDHWVREDDWDGDILW